MDRDGASDPLIGAMVTSYRIERLLGEGGMGKVYLGVHPVIGAQVAVKILHPVGGREAMHRLFLEAQAVNLIRHERIVNILDLGSLQGRPCVIMEYLEGAPLHKLVEEGSTLPLRFVARIGIEMLHALGAAHARNILHRDLKPSNVFISSAGHATLLDFGYAKFLDGGEPVTGRGQTVGTVPYMSPEQALGRELDARSDLFSLGVMLYEVATNRRPFQGVNVFSLRREHLEPLVKPRTLRGDIPPIFEEFLLQALRVDPNERFLNAEAMRKALECVKTRVPHATLSPVVFDNARITTYTPVMGVPAEFHPSEEASETSGPTRPRPGTDARRNCLVPHVSERRR